ncbi:MAG: type II secretion system protein [Candidatus Goldbacteria bacterium]|nr:type II secretion system protein [Candidatus Goldiibacteriota bacterium]
MKKQNGFTLIELMIVVAIIGILSAVAIPKFSDMLEKSREGATKGNVGAIKSAVSIYYGDNQGVFPTDLDTHANKFGAYLDRMPPVKVRGPSTNTFKLSGSDISVALETTAPPASIGTATDGWKYNNQTGDVWVNNSQPDSKGVTYSLYGYE